MLKIHPLGCKCIFPNLTSAIFSHVAQAMRLKMSLVRTENLSFSLPKTKFKHTLTRKHPKAQNMKRLILLFVLSSLALSSFSQRPSYGGGNWQKQGPSIKGKVTGKVIDSLQQAPIEFATLVLKSSADGKETSGGITDEKGSF